MKDHKRPIFGANGAVLNSSTISERLRDEYVAESNRSLKQIAAILVVVLVGFVLFAYATEQLLRWLSLPAWVVDYATLFLHGLFFVALVSKRVMVSTAVATLFVGLLFLVAGQNQDFSVLRGVLFLLAGAAAIWRQGSSNSHPNDQHIAR